MKVAYIASGAANMYCGSCMRDNALVAAMQRLGYDVSLIPMYTPMRLDEESVSEGHVFYGGVSVYMAQQFAHNRWLKSSLTRLTDSQRLLRWLNYFDLGGAVDASRNGDLAVSMLQGERGNQRQFLDALIAWLGSDLKPDMVHLTNTLFIGLAREIKRVLGVPIICGLHGEDIFLEGLRPTHRQAAIEIIRERCRDVDVFVATSRYYADLMGDWFALDSRRVRVVLPGIQLRDYQAMVPSPSTSKRPLTIGYFARIDPAKGLHLLAEAFRSLAADPDLPNVHLKVGGYLSKAYQSYLQTITQSFADAGIADRVEILGTVNRAEKLAFYNSIDLLSVPTVYRDPKGLFVLEALASGVPVVQPNHGIFPELQALTQGGVLHEPHDAVDLARKLKALLLDDAKRQQLGQAGKTAVFEHFSAERMATETMATYQQFRNPSFPSTG